VTVTVTEDISVDESRSRNQTQSQTVPLTYKKLKNEWVEMKTFGLLHNTKCLSRA
jgi:hypothetical protein